MAQEQIHQDSHAGCLFHLFWMGGGNVILFFCLTYILHNHVRTLAWVDLAYWLTVPAMIAARWVDIRSYKGDTVTGEPATISHLRKYAVLLPVVALVVWIIIHLLTLTSIV